MNELHLKYMAAKAELIKMINEQKVLIQQRTSIDGRRNGNYNSQFWDTVSHYDPVLHAKLNTEFEEVGAELRTLNDKVKLVTEYIAAALGVLYVLNGTDIRKDNIDRANFVKDRLFTLLSNLDNIPGLDNGVESSDQFIAGVSLLAAYNRQDLNYSL